MSRLAKPKLMLAKKTVEVTRGKRLTDRSSSVDLKQVDRPRGPRPRTLRTALVTADSYQVGTVAEKRVESIRKLVEEATALALVASKEQPVRVTLHLDPTIDLVLVDKVQIQQVLLNLMRNGIEAMQSFPHPELVVTTTSEAESMIAVKVADNGGGIDPEIRDRLFQPFVTTKRRGMGIGLSLCRTIINSHGGEITTEPNPDRGTVFRFTLRGASPEELHGGE